jgi:hypothetical protein
MRNQAIATLITASLALAGCGTELQSANAPDARGTPVATTTTEAHPSGTSLLRCDYSLAWNAADDPNYHFIGGGTLSNTGNVGIVVLVTYKWRLLGQGSVERHRTYRLLPGRSRDVDIRIRASQTQVEAHQAANSKCSAKAETIDTFGTVG